MIKYLNISKRPDLFNTWVGVMMIVAGLIFVLPQLMQGIFFPVIMAISLLLAGFCMLIFGYHVSGSNHGLVRYLNSAIFIVFGFTVLIYKDAGIQVISALMGSILMINGMFLLWVSVLLKTGKKWNSLLLTGVLSFIIAIILMIPGLISGSTLLVLAMAYLMIQSGYHLIQFGNNNAEWENEFQFNWDDQFREEMRIIRTEFFQYQMELMEIQISITAIRDELNRKINIDDIDPEKLRFSRMVSDLQEELKNLTEMTGDFSNWSRTVDLKKNMDKITFVKKMVDECKLQLEEIREKYPKVFHPWENKDSK